MACSTYNERVHEAALWVRTRTRDMHEAAYLVVLASNVYGVEAEDIRATLDVRSEIGML